MYIFFIFANVKFEESYISKKKIELTINLIHFFLHFIYTLTIFIVYQHTNNIDGIYINLISYNNYITFINFIIFFLPDMRFGLCYLHWIYIFLCIESIIINSKNYKVYYNIYKFIVYIYLYDYMLNIYIHLFTYAICMS